MDGACVTYGEQKKCILKFGGNPEGNRPNGAPGRREGGNTKT